MAKGLARLKQTAATPAVEGDEEEKEGYEDYELDDAVRTLERAAEIRQDAKLMAALQPHLEKKLTAIKSLEDLRSVARKKALEKK